MAPLLLLVEGDGGFGHALEEMLRPKGFVILKAYTEKGALDLVEKISPDAVLIAGELARAEFVTRIRSSPAIRDTTPILFIARGATGRAGRLDVFASGAWDILVEPVDPGELILRLDTFVRVKRLADRSIDESLTDPRTGVYNLKGTFLRAHELSADADRSGRPLACVVLGKASTRDVEADNEDDDERDQHVATVLGAVTRTSDAIGRLGPEEFAIIAPGTTRTGAQHLADRVFEALALRAGEVDHVADHGLRAGLSASDRSDPVSPEDLLLRATMALRDAQADDGGRPG